MPTPRPPSVFLKDDRLPDLDLWRREFAHIANASYSLRGIEMTLSGAVEQTDGQLRLVGNANRPSVLLAPLEASNKVQWDFATKIELATGGGRSDRLRETEANSERPEAADYLGCGHRYAAKE